MTENLVLSHNRDAIIDEFGSDVYHAIYNTLSTAACLSITWGLYRYRGTGPSLWRTSGTPLQASAFALQALGLIGFTQALPRLQVPVCSVPVKPAPAQDTTHSGTGPPPDLENHRPSVRFAAQCPFDFKPQDSADGVYGVTRVTRHPMLWSFGLFCAGTALASSLPTQAVAFGMPTVCVWVLGAHKDFRYRRGSGGILVPEFEARTSHLPFQALLSGRQSWDALSREMKWGNAAIGITFAAALCTRRVRSGMRQLKAMQA